MRFLIRTRRIRDNIKNKDHKLIFVCLEFLNDTLRNGSTLYS